MYCILCGEESRLDGDPIVLSDIDVVGRQGATEEGQRTECQACEETNTDDSPTPAVLPSWVW